MKSKVRPLLIYINVPNEKLLLHLIKSKRNYITYQW